MAEGSHCAHIYSFSILHSFTIYIYIPKMWLSSVAFELYKNRNILYIFFLRLLWLSIISARFLYVDVYIAAVCFLCYIAFYHMHLWFFIHSTTDGHLECFWFGAIKNGAVAEDASYPLMHSSLLPGYTARLYFPISLVIMYDQEEN